MYPHYKVKLVIVNPNRPGRFLKFSKNLSEKIQSSISPQLRVPEDRRGPLRGGL